MSDIIYELAKELKDAGFPQIGVGGYAISTNEMQRCIESGESVMIYCTKYNIPYLPTLAELIDACGEDLDVMSRFDGMWHVGKFEIGPLGKDKDLIVAVAKLYIALHKNDRTKN